MTTSSLKCLRANNFPTVADIPLTVVDIPTVADTFTLVIFWDIYYKLKSFDIKSCCMMSTYHNRT